MLCYRPVSAMFIVNVVFIGLSAMFPVNFILQALTELDEATTVSRRLPSDSPSAVSPTTSYLESYTEEHSGKQGNYQTTSNKTLCSKTL